MNKKIFLAIFSLWLAVCSMAQDKVFEKIEINANTDQKQWHDHIYRKSKLPDSSLQTIPAGTYKINVQFIIDKHGSIGQVRALNDPGFGLAQRAENVISSYKGIWKPAVQCGREVKAYRKEIITFQIPSQ